MKGNIGQDRAGMEDTHGSYKTEDGVHKIALQPSCLTKNTSINSCLRMTK
jgi:hypothetical protein